MTDRERHQANLLDGFIDNLDGSHSTPPDDLDPALASVAVMLAAELTPPDPSASFISRLGQGLTATSAEATNHQQAVLPPASDAELSATSAPSGWPATALPPRRSRLSEFTRLAAAGLAIMLIGSLLIFMFSEQDDELAPGTGVLPGTSERLFVVTWDGVTAVDPSSNEELYSVDAVNPDAALSPDGSRLFVTGVGGVDTLLAIDTASGDEIWRIQVQDRVRWIGGQGPSTLAVSPDGDQIYVYSSSAPDVYWVQIFDANSGERIEGTAPIIGYCPAILHPSQDENSLYLVCLRSGQVHEINLRTLRLQAGSSGSANFGSNAGAAMSPDGVLLYIVTLGNDGYNVALIRAAGSSQGGTLERRGGVVPLGEQEQPPVLGELVTLSPDGTRLYVAIGSEGNDDDAGTQDVREIAVFDTTSWEEIDRLTLDTPLNGGAFTMSPDGRYLYASERLQSQFDGKLIRIDVESGETSTVLVRNSEILRVIQSSQEMEQISDPAPQSEPTPVTSPEAGTEIELPGNLANQNHTAETVSMLTVNHEPLMTQDEAMATLAGEFSWALGGPWQDREITFDAWYGLATIGDDIRDQEIWLLDYGDLHGINGRVDCTNCPPLIGYNHNAYAIDARTGELIWSAAYREGLVEGEPPPAWLTYGEQAQLGVLSDTCFWPGGWGGCADSAGVFFPDDVLEVPQGSELAFSLEGMTGDDLLQPWAQAWPLDDDAEVEQLQGKQILVYTGQPSVSLPTSWSPTSMEITADLPPGEYVIQVDIRLPSDVDPPVNGQATTSGGSATIGFHVHVLEDGDQGSTSLPETGSGFQNQDQGFGDRSAHSFPSTPHSCHGRSSAGTVRCMDCQPNCGAHAVMFIA